MNHSKSTLLIGFVAVVFALMAFGGTVQAYSQTATATSAPSFPKLLPRIFKGHSGEVLSVAFSNDGQYIVTGSEDNTAILWNAQSGAQVHTFVGHSHAVNAVAFSPDGKYVLTGSADGTAILWDIQTGNQVRSFQDH